MISKYYLYLNDTTIWKFSQNIFHLGSTVSIEKSQQVAGILQIRKRKKVPAKFIFGKNIGFIMQELKRE